MRSRAHEHLNGFGVLLEGDAQYGHGAARYCLLHFGAVAADVTAVQRHGSTVETNSHVHAIISYGYRGRLLQGRLHRSQARYRSVRCLCQVPHFEYWHRSTVLVLSIQIYIRWLNKWRRAFQQYDMMYATYANCNQQIMMWRQFAQINTAVMRLVCDYFPVAIEQMDAAVRIANNHLAVTAG